MRPLLEEVFAFISCSRRVLVVRRTQSWAQAAVDAGEIDAGSPDAGEVDAGVMVAPPLTAAPTPKPPEQKQEPTRVEPPPDEAPTEPWFRFSDLLPITPALTSLHYDLSAVYASHNFGFAEGGMRATGLRFTERNSGLGKMTMYVVTQLLMSVGEAAAASGAVQKHVGPEFRPGYRIDYYQRFSADEVAAMRRSREQAGEDLLSSNMSLDLQLYLPVQGRSTSSGISIELTPLTVQFTDSGQVGMELAFAWTKLTDVVAATPPGCGPTRTWACRCAS